MLSTPLVVTLSLDHAAQAWFDALRRRHFPAGRLHVGAHITLFHALPGAREAEVVRVVAALCAHTPPFPVVVAGLRFLGRGVAFALSMPPAHALRATIATAFADELTAQDRAAWSPHVTVQNKVAADVARRTMADLAAITPPAPVRATGVAIWRYRGGPWEPVVTMPFAAMA